MDKNELWKLYCKKDKEFEKAKGKRTLVTILGFSIFYFMGFCVLEKPTDLEGIGALLLVSTFLGGIHVWINGSIFAYLCNKGRDESEVLKRIKKRMDEIDQNTH
jgi:hypothetical protein